MALLIGAGNPDRGDDAVGLAVARHVAATIATVGAPAGLTVLELPGNQLGLLDAWQDETDVYVADAVWSGGAPGTVYRFDASAPLAARFRHHGTHTLGLADVIELARALGRLPGRLTGYGIEGASFEPGAPAVRRRGRRGAGRGLRDNLRGTRYGQAGGRSG